ncbi:hypothetical protein PIB30_060633 [Stylosanthes scabra]|uniref:Uncharacterized protein n=1 Tax=Stylosanthes scabra TaxID=79078 RepID=A0ABU6ZJA4_9FABA|nr:hypothetical protein [Stylosanthes scabra]
MAQSYTIKGRGHLRAALPAPPSTPPAKLCPDSDEGTQEPGSSLPQTTPPLAKPWKDTRNQIARWCQVARTTLTSYPLIKVLFRGC